MNYALFEGFKDPEADQSDLLDVRGVRKTETLFLESISTASKANYEPLYTLREQEKQGKPSAYQIYMHSIDEADAALKLVGSLAHWRKLLTLKWFREGSEAMGHEGIEQWREDMRARDATRAKEVLLRLAREGNVTAANSLAKMSAPKGPVGRPQKKDSADARREKDIRSAVQRIRRGD